MMTTVDATLPDEYEALTARLEAAGGRYWVVKVVRGLGWFLALVVPVMVGAVFVAGYFSLPEWVHVVLLGVIAAVVVAGYAAFLHGAIFGRPSMAQVARVVEMNGVPLNNALINAVLLGQELEGGGAKGWIPHVLREASGAVGDVALERRVPWRPARGAWGWAGAAIVAACVVGVLFPGVLGHGFFVLTRPNHFVPRQGVVRILGVTPGNDTALAGQAVSFTVRVEVPERKTIPARVDVRYASGRSESLPMVSFGVDNTQYVRQGVVASEDMDYVITAGDTQSERYHIAVVPQIGLRRFQVDVVPPAYTGIGGQRVTLTGVEVDSGKGVLDVAAGSKVTLSAGLDGPAREVLMDVVGGGGGAGGGGGRGPVVMGWDAGRDGFSTSVVLRESMRFVIRVNDGGNRTLAQFPGKEYFSLNVVPDMPPSVVVTQPGRDLDARPGDKLQLEVQASDDVGLKQVRLEVAKNNEREFRVVQRWDIAAGNDGKPVRAATFRYTLDLPASGYVLGDTLRYRFAAVDNRDLTAVEPGLGSQVAAGQIFAVYFNDKTSVAVASGKLWEELRQKLTVILEKQVGLRKDAQALVTGISLEEMRKAGAGISEGQKGIRGAIEGVAKDFPFDSSMKLVQKALQVLVVEDAAFAVDRSADVLLLSDPKALPPLANKLRQHQSRIIDLLQTLLAMIVANEEKLARIANHEGGDIPTDARAAWKKMAEDLKQFEKEQQNIISMTASVAKKPKDAFDANDAKTMKELAVQEDKWEKLMSQRIADMSRLTEQDSANASLLEEMVQMKVELATARDALQQNAAEVAVPVEENGLEDAKLLTSHIERWLSQNPDRIAWQMEEMFKQNEPPGALLPRQMQDMVGELMDKEEDLTGQMESLASKYHDSLDKTAGWDAVDGPISNMTAMGVTGNQMPKDMEIQGRAGEGREARASGEMVGSTAEGKEGRQTPTRLTPDGFARGQVDDKSKLPQGGATGGGKKGGVGSEGLEGPSAQDQLLTQRLAGKQATIRNDTERLSLKMRAAGFDNFKLVEANAYLKKSEDALKQNHYVTALYYQEEAVQSLNTAKVLASGQVHVIADSSPTASERSQKDMESALNGPMPRGYGDPVKAYFEKLAGE